MSRAKSARRRGGGAGTRKRRFVITPQLVAGLLVAVAIGVGIGLFAGGAEATRAMQALASPPPPVVQSLPAPPSAAARLATMPNRPFAPPPEAPTQSHGPASSRLPGQAAKDAAAAPPSVAAPALQVAAVQPPPLVERSRLPAWRKYAAPAPAFDGRPQIAVVIDDVGLDRRRSARAIRLPGAVTLAFLPYADGVQEQAQEARRGGHELLVHLPMEALDRGADPGPNALYTHLDEAEIVARVRANLDRFAGYVGVNNHMGSRFTGFQPGMELLMAELRSRGLLFLDSRTSGDSVAYRTARRHGLPSAARDVFLDHDEGGENVAQQLRAVEDVARRHGAAIAIGHPLDATLDQLERWIPTLEQRGFQLAPLSALILRSQQG